MRPVIKLPKTEMTADEIIAALETVLTGNKQEFEESCRKLQNTFREVRENQKRVRGAHSEN